MSHFFRSTIVVLLLLYAVQLKAQSILFNSSGGTPDPSALMELRSTEKGILVPRMLEINRLSILSPAQGLLVFQTNGTIGFYFHNGTGWDTLGGATTVTNINNVNNVTSSGIAVIRDEKTSGTNGGTFTSGAWQQRDLNTISGDVSFVTLGTNNFTLDTGIYVITVNAPASDVDRHQIRLYNNTKLASAAVGTMAFTGGNVTSSSTIFTVEEVGAGGETFIIEHQCTASKTTSGFGLGATWTGGESVFTQVKIEKL
ncbi:MAG: hypothetical protein JKY48_00425 [Flavobacteriales bacterium]|nr:hypothetical protein [Flavobacteriales bacterium]